MGNTAAAVDQCGRFAPSFHTIHSMMCYRYWDDARPCDDLKFHKIIFHEGAPPDQAEPSFCSNFARNLMVFDDLMQDAANNIAASKSVYERRSSHRSLSVTTTMQNKKNYAKRVPTW